MCKSKKEKIQSCCPACGSKTGFTLKVRLIKEESRSWTGECFEVQAIEVINNDYVKCIDCEKVFDIKDVAVKD